MSVRGTGSAARPLAIRTAARACHLALALATDGCANACEKSGGKPCQEWGTRALQGTSVWEIFGPALVCQFNAIFRVRLFLY